jgi:hypothetical protein
MCVAMNNLLKKVLLFALLLPGLLPAQSLFDIRLDTMSIPGLPGLHSFAVGEHDGKWLLIGGRRDGMHLKFNAFGTSGANQNIFIVEPLTGQLWQRSLAELPDTLREQLHSTNMEFVQTGETLLFAGGYGRSEVAQNHVTYPYLTLIDVPGLMDAVTGGGALLPHFQQIRDTFFAVTGGQLLPIADTFYLVGGHFFEGVYSANSGPNLTQVYTDAIRKFTLGDNNGIAAVTHKSTIVDELNLHRRDYNMAPQILQNGEPGLVAFSGVFQPGLALLPFQNVVEIDPSGHKPVDGFTQYLANYHCAKAPLYAQGANEMHTLFFGGMSQYWLDAADSLIKDNRVPFVRTVSRVSRLADGQYEEVAFDAELPFFTGTSAEFIFAEGVPLLPNGVADYDAMPDGEQLLGYIVGGIVTPETQRNPFVTNNLGLTSASPRLIRVFLLKNTTGTEEGTLLPGRFDPQMSVTPNPASDHWTLRTNLPRAARLFCTLQDARGKILRQTDWGQIPAGTHDFELPASSLPAGAYWLTLNVDGLFMTSKTITKF